MASSTSRVWRRIMPARLASTLIPPLALFLTITTALAPSTTDAQERFPAETDLLEVMFIQPSMVRLFGNTLEDLSGLNATEGLESLLAFYPHEWSRMSDVPVEVLDELEMIGEDNTGLDLYNLNNVYRLRLFAPVDPWLLAHDIEVLPGVHMAYPVPLPQELPLPPSYVGNQGYLNPASSTPTGIDALYAWTQPGGDGWYVTICDLEYDWNYDHIDLTMAQNSQINTNVADPFFGTPYASEPHGTAVLGVLVSGNNGFGTTGIAYSAGGLKTCGTYYGTPPTWNVAGAITLSISVLQAGDIILLEQQWDYSGSAQLGHFVPIEWWNATTGLPQGLNVVYAAIQTAVANGIHVVQAGGNGNVDTDTLSWQGDSGAIIVGAGGAYAGGTWSEGDLQRLSFSSYGSRFDLQGWGEDVVTTGYGDLHSSEGHNLYYTSSFSGTSSASPIVAGAVASLQGWWAGAGNTVPISPAQMRSVLKATGTPQITPPAGHIGPRPDLAAAIAALATPPQWTDVTAGPLGDTGTSLSMAWGDLDQDGLPDIYIVNSQSSCRLLRNMHPGGFIDITSFPESNQAFGTCAMWGDWDNDGDADLYVTNFNTFNRLLENQHPGMPRFMDHARMPESSPADGAGIQWIDYNRDGWADLYVTNFTGASNQLYRNLGHGLGFAPVLALMLDDVDNSRDAAWGDFDNDGDLDCYLVKWGTLPNFLVRNDGPHPDPNSWMFSIANIPALMQDTAPGGGACWGDVDNDGDLDLYVVNYGAPNRLWRNDGPDPMDPHGWLFTDVTTPPLADPTGNGMGACWFDYDNDGDLDLYIVNYGQANRLLRNDGGGVFTDDTHGPLSCAAAGTAASFADYNLDGFLDLYVANEGTANKLLRNDVANGNNWLKIKLNATSSNGSAIGARVMLWTAAKGMQMREVGDMTAGTGQEDPLIHFGLGGNTMVDSLRVVWPGGIVQDTLSVAVNQVLYLTEPASSSVEPSVPAALALGRAYPNPFNPGVTIEYGMPRGGVMELSVYSPDGRLVRVLDRAAMEAGLHTVYWNGCDDRGRRLASGVYFVHLKAFGEVKTQKVSLVK